MTRKEMVSCDTKVHGVAFSCQNLMCSKERRHKVKNLVLELLKTQTMFYYICREDR